MDRSDQRKPYWRYDEEDTEDMREFREGHGSLSDRVERFLMQLVILGLVSLALVQTLHTNTTVRRMLSAVERFEGIPWNQVTAWSTESSEAVVPVAVGSQPVVLTVVCLSRPSAPQVRLLVGGKAVGTFSSGSVSTVVVPGQDVAVDGTAIAEPLTFRVVGPADLVSPVLGMSVTVQGNIRTLGVVQTER